MTTDFGDIKAIYKLPHLDHRYLNEPTLYRLTAENMVYKVFITSPRVTRQL